MKINFKTIEDMSNGLLNYLWPRSEMMERLADLSVRKLVLKRLINIIILNKTIEFTSSKSLIEYYEENEVFRVKVHSIIENVFCEFNELVEKFGGKNYLFIWTLLHINFEDSDLNDAKNNIIDWYFGDFHMSLGSIKGNIQSAWFPFNEFEGFFSNIATNIFSAILYGGGVSIIHKILSDIKGNKCLPQSIVDAAETENIEIIKEKMGTSYREKLYIFELSKEQVDQIEFECVSTMKLLLSSYSANEIEVIHKILNNESIINNDETIFLLRSKGIVKNIEMQKDIIKPKLFDIFHEKV